eukprot:13604892-Alexandrium_andersonii.AAC.1
MGPCGAPETSYGEACAQEGCEAVSPSGHIRIYSFSLHSVESPMFSLLAHAQPRGCTSASATRWPKLDA